MPKKKPSQTRVSLPPAISPALQAAIHGSQQRQQKQEPIQPRGQPIVVPSEDKKKPGGSFHIPQNRVLPSLPTHPQKTWRSTANRVALGGGTVILFGLASVLSGGTFAAAALAPASLGAASLAVEYGGPIADEYLGAGFHQHPRKHKLVYC